MEITLREFQRHFHRYKSQECEVFGVRGEPVGNWIPAGVTVKKEEDLEEIEEVGGGNDSHLPVDDTEKGRKFAALKAKFDVREAPAGEVTVIEEKVSDKTTVTGGERGTLTEGAERCIKCGALAEGVAQTANEVGELDDWAVCRRCARYYKLKFNGYNG